MCIIISNSKNNSLAVTTFNMHSCHFLSFFFDNNAFMPLQARDPLLFGSSKHVPKLMQSFVEVMGHGTELVDEPLGRRMAGLLHSMRPSLPGDLVEGAFASLSDKQKTAFSAYMASQPLPS